MNKLTKIHFIRFTAIDGIASAVQNRIRYEHSKNFIAIVNDQLCVRFKSGRASRRCRETMDRSSVYAAIMVNL